MRGHVWFVINFLGKTRYNVCFNSHTPIPPKVILYGVKNHVSRFMSMENRWEVQEKHYFDHLQKKKHQHQKYEGKKNIFCFKIIFSDDHSKTLPKIHSVTKNNFLDCFGLLYWYTWYKNFDICEKSKLH